jgi:hypothetical protein
VRTEDLIGQLAGELTPVRRMAPPGVQAGAWLAMAVAAIGLAVAFEGFRHDLAERIALPQEVAQWVASVTTGVAAAVAAAMLARPDRPWQWALLPLVPLIAWLGSLGWGCLEDLARLGVRAWHPGTSWGCFRFVVGLGVPLTAALLLLLRHAGPVRPGPVLVLAGLASAALCSAGLTLFHHLDASLEILIWHGGAVAVVALLGRLAGAPLLMRTPAVP